MLAISARSAFAPGAFLQKHCDSENKPAKPNKHAGFKPIGY